MIFHFSLFSMLPGLSRALLGAVDIDLIPRMVLSLFPKMMEKVHSERHSERPLRSL